MKLHYVKKIIKTTTRNMENMLYGLVKLMNKNNVLIIWNGLVDANKYKSLLWFIEQFE